MATSRAARQLRPRPWIDRPPTGEVDASAVIDREIRLVGATAQATVKGAIVSAPLKATRRGPAQLSLVVADPERELLTHRLLDRDVDLLMDHGIDTRIGGIWWRVAGLEPDQDTGQVTVLMEDRSGMWLRGHRRRIRAVRGQVTRAQFAHRMHREAGGGIDLWVPELHDPQQIAKSKGDGNASPAAGGSSADWTDLPDKVRIYNGELEMTPARKDIAATLLGVAARLKAPRKATLAMIEAALVESNLGNPTTPDRYGSIGTFQPRVGLSVSPRGPGTQITREEALDVELMARQFLRGPAWTSWNKDGTPLGAIAAVSACPDMTAGQIAQKIEGSAYPERYDQSKAGAEAILAAYQGGALDGDGAGGGGSSGAYTFERGPDGRREDSLACCIRLADEVPGWRYWVYSNRGVFASDVELIQQPTVLVLERDNPNVRLRWRLDARHSARQMTAEVLVDRLPEPGQVALVRGEASMANGRWLIDEVTCDLVDLVDTSDERLLRATLTLARAERKGKEPAATRRRNSSATGTSKGARAVYDEAVRISDQQLPYSWGGGHARAGTPSRGTNRSTGGQVVLGYDCSGYVAACLAAAGWGYKPGDSVPASGTMARSWGKPGKGKEITLWANDQHVFIEFHGLGTWKRADTSGTRAVRALGGPRVWNEMVSTAGFTPRHWEDDDA